MLNSQCRTLPIEALNTSDHLPLFADMMYVPTLEEKIHHVLPRVDWMKAVSSGDIENYRQEVAKCLNRLANNSYDCVEEVERELYYVSKLLCDSAVRSLPLLQHRKKLRWRDSTLTALCAKSRIARKVWREAGSPSNGPLYDEKCHLHRAVRKRVRFCAAQAENRRIQRRDLLFSSGDKGHFGLPQRKKRFTQSFSVMVRSLRAHSPCWMLGLNTLRIWLNLGWMSSLSCRVESHM